MTNTDTNEFIKVAFSVAFVALIIGVIMMILLFTGSLDPRRQIEGQAVEVYTFQDGYEPITYTSSYDTWMCRDPYDRIINCHPFYTVDYQPAILERDEEVTR